MPMSYEQSKLFEFELRKVAWQQISAYLRCPLEYHYRVSSEGKIFDPTGPRIEEGRILHKLVQGFLKEQPKKRTNSWLAEKISDWKKEHDSSYWLEVGQTLEAALESFLNPVLTNLSVLKLEKSVGRKHKDLLLVGRIDCLGIYGGRLLLIDFKLNKCELEHLRDSVDKFLQLTLYAYCLELDNQLGNRPVELVYFFLSEGIIESQEVDTSAISRGLHRIEDITSQLDNDNEWLPRKNALCGTCGVRRKGLCPLWERR